jgi:hypothetical protein
MDSAGTNNDLTFRIGVDFGNDTLVISTGGNDSSGIPLVFPGWTEKIPSGESVGHSASIPVCIRFTEAGEPILGAAAGPGDTASLPSTARWMRKYVLENSPVRMPGVGSRGMRYQDAGEAFLRSVLARIIREAGRSAAIVFTVPSDAPEHYIPWLGRIAGAAGTLSWQTIDESRAVVAGYGLVPSPGDAFLILRCDELELDASVVVVENLSAGRVFSSIVVRGKATEPTGCGAIDSWIARDLIARDRRGWGGAGGRGEPIPPALLLNARYIRSRLIRLVTGPADLSVAEFANVPVPEYSPEDFARILASNGFFTTLERTIDRALALARSRGFDDQALRAVLLVGTGCALPAVKDAVRERFDGHPVHCDRPCDAAAFGAVLSVAPSEEPGQIRRDYALRYWDPAAREHRYRFIVHSGTRFPSAGQVARVTICAAYDGQTQLGIPLYEMPSPQGDGISALELVAEETGGVRLAGPAPDSVAQARPLPVSGGIPVYLAASPPAVKGEPRFELTFTINDRRCLCVTVRDLATNWLLKTNEEIHMLM